MRIFVALVLFLLSADSYSNEKFSISYFGDIINNTGDIEAVYKGSKTNFNISGCSIKWKINDPFYVVKISDDEIYAIKKDTYDNLTAEYDDDDKVTRILLDNRSICSVSLVNTA